MGRRKRAGRNQLFEKGLLAVVIGGALLTIPLFLKGSPLLQPVAQGLKTPGWVTLALGVVLLIAGRVTRNFTRDASERASASAAPVPKRSRWEAQVFDDIEWRRFEAVCECLFSQAGFRTESKSHGADGGVDIWLYSKHVEGPAAVVQCKHWVGRAVGVKEVREFFGVMTSNSLKRGTYITSSTFTAAAVDFAKGNGINILDGNALLAQIARRSPEQQQELLAIAYEGEYWRPTCASCGVKLVERMPAQGGSRFWGCPNFPRCRTRMAARGA